ncbi:MAG: hypothetical protein EZS28_042671 [Streblomastix strix]|uniref:Uncharacterized protein n=1 Tax=Streblomastix strix TaxID=222440 RepID=A0A5J4TV98_9EUKA|nr:MAG: hypothetical protein EZS28_042671 [Streblomastix strix]
MQTEQEIQDVAKAIISFADTYTQNKQRKEKEQSEFESKQSLLDIVSSLNCLRSQIRIKRSCKQMIQIPKLLQSLSTLSRFKEVTHLREEIDHQRFTIRNSSRQCLWNIQYRGDEQIQTELVNQGYGRMMSLSFSTAGGVGEEYDQEIWNVSRCISAFLRERQFRLDTGVCSSDLKEIQEEID